MAKQNPAFKKYQAILAKVRKDHPNMKFSSAQRRASELFHKEHPVSGVKKKVAGKKKAVRKVAIAGKPKAKTKVAGTRKRVTHTKVAPTRKVSKHESPTLKKGKELERKIAVLETKRKESGLKEYRDLVQLEINKTHKALKALHRKI